MALVYASISELLLVPCFVRCLLGCLDAFERVWTVRNRNARSNTYTNTHSRFALKLRYDNQSSPGEPFTSYGIEGCSTGSPHEEGPEGPQDYPDTCLGLDAAMIDTFADYDFSTSNVTYVVHSYISPLE